MYNLLDPDGRKLAVWANSHEGPFVRALDPVLTNPVTVTLCRNCGEMFLYQE